MQTAAPLAFQLVPIGQRVPALNGLYAGISRGEDGQPDGHLILLDALPTAKMNWADACAWAKGLGNDARLPTRDESALLCANVHDSIEKGDWYWTGTQSSSGRAWLQRFDDGSQFSYSKKFEARARAVRRFSFQSFNPSVDSSPKPDTSTALLRQLLDETKGLRTDLQTIFLGDTGVVA